MLSSIFQAPASFRLRSSASHLEMPFQMTTQAAYDLSFEQQLGSVHASAHDSHPALGHLVLLVFEAVLEVVCVSLPGYIVARAGYFDAEKQKFLANLNVQLFTPCLIFTKLASQLNARKLGELAIIPVIFLVQTLVSWLVSVGVARAFGFGRRTRAANFVTAMGVFGNSNSLPISLVMSLSQTIKGLHWDRIPGDNDDEVAARGILYLLIFQQLGQLVRWSWGYHVLLAPKDKYEEYSDERVEEGYAENETAALLDGHSDSDEDETASGDDYMHYEPAGQTPVVGSCSASTMDACIEDDDDDPKKDVTAGPLGLSSNHPLFTPDNEISSFPRIRSRNNSTDDSELSTTVFQRIRHRSKRSGKALAGFSKRQYHKLPQGVRRVLDVIPPKVNSFLVDFMNPPLWAMLVAVLVASVPSLQQLFFEDGSFIKNSVTNAVQSSGGVAVPLILVVLGANLAGNTQRTENVDAEEAKIGNKLLIASLISRMVLPIFIMAPLLAMTAKYVPISILDDPIFVIVCAILISSPPALQLSAICQLNNVFEGVMSKILFQGYVVWILPSTLIQVLYALEIVEWANDS